MLKGGGGEEHQISIAEISTEQKVLPVYNLEVANAHTFFVGEEGVLVHNAKCPIKPSTPKVAKRKVDRGQGPPEIKQIHSPEEGVPGSQWHAHQATPKGGKNPAFNQDGGPHDGTPDFSNKTKDWLRQHGWKNI